MPGPRKVSARLSCGVSAGQRSIGFSGRLHMDGEIGVLRLRRIDFGKAGMDWRMLIDLDDDEVQAVCRPFVEEGNRFSDDFRDIVGDPGTVTVLEKVGLYREHRGGNLLGPILDIVRSLCPNSAVVLCPVPLQHHDDEENLRIMGIKRKAPESRREENTLRLVRHYERHGFRRVGQSSTWALDGR